MKLLIGFFLFSALLFANDTTRLTYEECMRLRIPVIEERLGLSFDPFWSPRIYFSLPSYYPPEKSADVFAHYNIENQSFYFNPRYIDSSIRFLQKDFSRTASSRGDDTSFSARVREMMDHELGHALADQLSRSLGFGPWPISYTARKKFDFYELLGIGLLVEGVGEFFGRTSFPRFSLDISVLPDTLIDLSWWFFHKDFYIYEGGYALVSPILEEFGRAGLIYIMTHPLRIEEGLVQRAVENYVSRAFNVLEKTRK